jgi:general secretion pathway protein H
MRCQRTAPRKRGFTLIELMVVVLIMGLFVGLVSAIVRPDDRALLRVEAERLAQLLELAGTEASLAGKPVAWTADASGYRFWRLAGAAGWLEVRDSDLLRERSLPAGMRITGLSIENIPARGAPRLEFLGGGTAPAFSVELALGSARYAVTGSPIGEVKVLPGADHAQGG